MCPTLFRTRAVDIEPRFIRCYHDNRNFIELSRAHTRAPTIFRCCDRFPSPISGAHSEHNKDCPGAEKRGRPFARRDRAPFRALFILREQCDAWSVAPVNSRVYLRPPRKIRRLATEMHDETETRAISGAVKGVRFHAALDPSRDRRPRAWRRHRRVMECSRAR